MTNIKKLNINNEFSKLKNVIMGKGTSIPNYKNYYNNSLEFKKHHCLSWDNKLFVKQHKKFIEILKKYGVQIHFINENNKVPWQAYARDTAFIIKDKIFYNNNRTLPERKNEINEVLPLLSEIKKSSIIKIKNGKIEGGDVIVTNDEVFIGISQRTNTEAIKEIQKYFPVKTFFLGKNVMHLDCKLCILPNKKILLDKDVFSDKDLNYLNKKYELIELQEDEKNNLAANIFIINPNTIIIEKKQKRLQKILKKNGFNLEIIDYSEPNAISGSFRCTTMPIYRC